MGENDNREDDLYGENSTDRLPSELADLQPRREKLEQIQRDLQAMDDARRKDGIDPAKNPAQIPKHDPDSRVLSNQEVGQVVLRRRSADQHIPLLLRGLDKVEREWLWTGTAINFDNLARGMRRLHTELEMQAMRQASQAKPRKRRNHHPAPDGRNYCPVMPQIWGWSTGFSLNSQPEG